MSKKRIPEMLKESYQGHGRLYNIEIAMQDYAFWVPLESCLLMHDLGDLTPKEMEIAKKLHYKYKVAGKISLLKTIKEKDPVAYLKHLISVDENTVSKHPNIDDLEFRKLALGVLMDQEERD